jgi:hypothetical protein
MKNLYAADNSFLLWQLTFCLPGLILSFAFTIGFHQPLVSPTATDIQALQAWCLPHRD